jgi:hypothetical protein
MLSAGKALDLAAELGWVGPETRNPMLAALAKIPSSRLRKLLFAIQARARGAIAGGGKREPEADR